MFKGLLLFGFAIFVVAIFALAIYIAHKRQEHPNSTNSFAQDMKNLRRDWQKVRGDFKKILH